MENLTIFSRLKKKVSNIGLLGWILGGCGFVFIGFLKIVFPIDQQSKYLFRAFILLSPFMHEGLHFIAALLCEIEINKIKVIVVLEKFYGACIIPVSVEKNKFIFFLLAPVSIMSSIIVILWIFTKSNNLLIPMVISAFQALFDIYFIFKMLCKPQVIKNTDTSIMIRSFLIIRHNIEMVIADNKEKKIFLSKFSVLVLILGVLDFVQYFIK